VTGATGSLRVVTANLYNDRADPDVFARLMGDLEADVVAVQELGPAQAAALARVLPFGALEPARNHMGSGVALRRPGRVARLALPFRSGWVAEVAPPAGPPVEIVNVHVLAPHYMPTWRALAIRRAQLRALLAYLDSAPPRPRALLGDLNATPAWPVYRRLAARFADAAVEAARANGGGPQATWGPWPSAPRLFRLDHCLVAGLVALRAQVVDLPGSDHSALVVDLAVPASS